jgi:antirestriction protein ArdC
MALRAHRRKSSAPDVPRQESPSFAELLREAITKPGVLSACYFHFHDYSIGNQLAAWAQCLQRAIPLGPISTFKGWLALNRHVKRGEKAILLCMPVTFLKKREPASGESTDSADLDRPPPEVTRKRFVWRPNWFVLSQTDGSDYVPLSAPAWDEATALATLNISRVEFAMADGNCQGYATGRSVAVSPIAYQPQRTLMHEVAHVVLGHTAESNLSDGSERTPRDVREVEAEAVSYLVCQSLALCDGDFSRGYLQHWLTAAHGTTRAIDDRTAQRILHAADQILKAGRPTSPHSSDVPTE